MMFRLATHVEGHECLGCGTRCRSGVDGKYGEGGNGILHAASRREAEVPNGARDCPGLRPGLHFLGGPEARLVQHVCPRGRTPGHTCPRALA